MPLPLPLPLPLPVSVVAPDRPPIGTVVLRHTIESTPRPDDRLEKSAPRTVEQQSKKRRTALGQRAHITIYGEDYDTPDGTCIRDYIHVADLVDAHVLALRYLEGGGASAAFNLGNGEGFSVRQVVDAARRVTDRDFEVQIAARRDGDPARLVADPSRAREMLGWNPRRGDLETQIADAWRWHRKKLGSGSHETR